VLRALREQGTTILLITHKLKEVMRLCDQVTVMRAGRVVAEVAIARPPSKAWPRPWWGARCTWGASTRRANQAGEVLLQASGCVVRDAWGGATGT
jgi:ABC-type uncharacterized transport system ATPase subunit